MGLTAVKKKIYVIDQNVMRRAEFDEFIAGNSDAKFVIPDTGLVEMVKSERWEETFRHSFRKFTPLASRCFMSLSIQEARELEQASRTSAVGHLLPREFTALLRGAIVESQVGTGPTMSLLRERMAAARDDLQRHDLNAEANRGELQLLVSRLRTGLTMDEIKACRQSGMAGRVARLSLARGVGDTTYVAYMKNAGVPEPVSRRLWKTKSITRRWCYMAVHQALQWLGDGGLEAATDKAVLNDVLDQDYVILGSVFDGIISSETDVRNAVQDLDVMLALYPNRAAP